MQQVRNAWSRAQTTFGQARDNIVQTTESLWNRTKPIVYPKGSLTDHLIDTASAGLTLAGGKFNQLKSAAASWLPNPEASSTGNLLPRLIGTEAIASEKNASASLHAKKLTNFKRGEDLFPTKPPEAVEENTEFGALNSQSKLTNKNLAKLSGKISNFAAIYYMWNVIGGNTGTNIELYKMCKRAENCEMSLLKSFLTGYESIGNAKALSLFKKFRCLLFYFLVFPIIKKVVSAYANAFLNEFRSELLGKRNQPNREALSSGILADMERILIIYLGNYSTFAYAEPAEGSLGDQHKKNLPDLAPICLKVGRAVVNHFRPNMGLLAPIQWIVRWVLKRRILPSVVESLVRQGEANTQIHNYPFFTALNQALTEQISVLEDMLQKHSNDLDSPKEGLVDPRKLKTIVRTMFQITLLDKEPANQFALRNALERLHKDPNKNATELYRKVQDSMEDSIAAGLSSFMLYIADWQNSEALLSKLFELLAIPFDNVEDSWDGNTKARHEQSKKQLDRRAKEFLSGIISTAIQKEFKNESSLKLEERSDEIFGKRKLFCRKMAKEVWTISKKKPDIDSEDFEKGFGSLLNMKEELLDHDDAWLPYIDRLPPSYQKQLQDVFSTSKDRLQKDIFQHVTEIKKHKAPYQDLKKLHSGLSDSLTTLTTVGKTLTSTSVKDTLIPHFRENPVLESLSALVRRDINDHISRLQKSVQEYENLYTQKKRLGLLINQVNDFSLPRKKYDNAKRIDSLFSDRNTQDNIKRALQGSETQKAAALNALTQKKQEIDDQIQQSEKDAAEFYKKLKDLLVKQKEQTATEQTIAKDKILKEWDLISSKSRTLRSDFKEMTKDPIVQNFFIENEEKVYKGLFPSSIVAGSLVSLALSYVTGAGMPVVSPFITPFITRILEKTVESILKDPSNLVTGEYKRNLSGTFTQYMVNRDNVASAAQSGIGVGVLGFALNQIPGVGGLLASIAGVAGSVDSAKKTSQEARHISEALMKSAQEEATSLVMSIFNDMHTSIVCSPHIYTSATYSLLQGFAGRYST